MQFDRSQIVKFLEERGKHDKAEDAQEGLPEKVDTDRHVGLLALHGLPVEELIAKLGGNFGNLTSRL